MTVTPTTPPDLRRQYPHVDGVEDWRAQQSLRLLWDRIFDLEARLQAAEINVGGLVSATNAQDDHLTTVERMAQESLALAQASRDERIAAGEEAEEAGGLPSDAPDMSATLAATYAAGAPGPVPWDLSEDFGPTGKSKFLEAAVDDLHAIDANWGHVAKYAGQHGSVSMGGDGHAVDAINWKNPDGITAEIYDVISSTGALQWNYDSGSRSNGDALSRWLYPA